jgi:glycerol uptake facilitator-like aquaporin
MQPRNRRLAAEFFGTFWLVFGGCGAAIFAGAEIGSTASPWPSA